MKFNSEGTKINENVCCLLDSRIWDFRGMSASGRAIIPLESWLDENVPGHKKFYIFIGDIVTKD